MAGVARVLRDLPWWPKHEPEADIPVVAATDAEPEVAIPVIDLVAEEAAEETAATPRDASAARSESRAVTMTISNRIDPVYLPRLWQMYRDAFEPLREVALLNHLYPQ